MTSVCCIFDPNLLVSSKNNNTNNNKKRQWLLMKLGHHFRPSDY